MRLTVALIGFAVLLAAAGNAHASRMPRPPQLIPYHEACPDGDSVACADPATARVWVAPGAGRFAWSHEIGHVWWEQVATESDRQWITYKLGWPRYTEWCSGEHGMPTPCEVAADAYAACDLGLTPAGRWETSYGYLPTVRQHRRICNAIVILGIVRTSG